MKNKKKKGFTLIELIAVIAILGILAALIVPNITGYSKKAKIAKIKANAKTVLNVIKTEQTTKDASTISNYNDAIDSSKGDPSLAISYVPSNMKEKTADELASLAGTPDDDTSTWTDDNISTYLEQ